MAHQFHTVSGRKPRGRQRGGLVQFRCYRAVWCLGRDADPVFCVAWQLGIAIRDGGAKRALSAAGIGWDRAEALRITCIGIIMAAYIFGLVPRVDFILASGLTITAFIYRFHEGKAGRMKLVAAAAAAVAAAGLYALIAHFPQAEWNTPHDDDWVTLLVWLALTAWMLRAVKSRIARATPWIAALAPLILICAMAFGFRQNIPNRGGLLFSQIEYHYYVTLRPLWKP